MNNNKNILLHVFFFANLREQIGLNSVVWEISSTSTVKDIIIKISKEFNISEKIISKYLYAVNNEYVDIDAKFKNQDELAIIPPVSGGL
tara:strand:- start:4481 stop:4747 length:267 start_codon:yes stop_codon:yes gene_type:complete